MTFKYDYNESLIFVDRQILSLPNLAELLLSNSVDYFINLIFLIIGLGNCYLKHEVVDNFNLLAFFRLWKSVGMCGCVSV